MNRNLIEQLVKAFGVTQSHFILLQLGFTLEDFTRRINFSRLVREVNIKTPDGRIYNMPSKRVSDVLQQFYDNPLAPTPISHLTFLNSLRAITMSLVTAIDSTEYDGTSHLASIYQSDIFDGDAAKTDSFIGITRFIRNVLSHNIDEQLNLQDANFISQLNYRNSRANKFGLVMRFDYDYGNPKSAIYIKGYSPGLNIEIDLSKLKAGQMLDEIIPTYDALLFAEFCYNSLFFLHNKYVGK